MAIVVPITFGTILNTSVEETLYEAAGYQPLSVFLDMTLSASADITVIRVYGKAIPSGNYVLVDDEEISGVLAIPGYKSIFFDFPYGTKFTIQRTAGANFNVPWSVDTVS